MSCERSPAFDAQLAERLGPEAARARPLEAEVDIRELPSGLYELTVEVVSSPGRTTRTIELADCAEAQRAAAIVIATAVTADGRSAEREHTRSEPPGIWSLRLGMIGDLRALPKESLGPAVGAGYGVSEHFLVWGEARYLLARQSAPSGGVRAEVDLFALGIGTAHVWTTDAFSFGPAIEAEFGGLRGRAAGMHANGSRIAPWLCGWGGVVTGYAWGPLVLALSLQLGVPVLRPRFLLPNDAQPYRAPPVTGRVQLGVSIALGAKKRAAGGQ